MDVHVNASLFGRVHDKSVSSGVQIFGEHREGYMSYRLQREPRRSPGLWRCRCFTTCFESSPHPQHRPHPSSLLPPCSSYHSFLSSSSCPPTLSYHMLCMCLLVLCSLVITPRQWDSDTVQWTCWGSMNYEHVHDEALQLTLQTNAPNPFSALQTSASLSFQITPR